ncbi:RHS domain-containing protein [Enterobacter sp. 120016]|nr:RHS domain-containing protein [Enterobacter sp. 120016]
MCDHLGTPLELRDVQGGVVWSACCAAMVRCIMLILQG